MQNETAAQAAHEPAHCAGADGLLVILFAVGIALPLLGYLADVKNFAGNSTAPSNENRRLDGLPTWDGSLAALWTLPKNFERHFNDHFGYRKHLVELAGRTKALGLGDSSHSHVILGRDGWLFYAFDENGQSARTPRPFQPAELRKWRSVLEARTSWLGQRNCQYLFVVAPEKQSVYSQYLPNWLPEYPQVHTRTAQLIDFVRGGPAAANIFDLGDPLRTVAAHEQVFYRTDTHWNDDGAFVAYTAIIRILSERFPGMEPLPPSRLRRTTSNIQGRDLARLLGVARHVTDEQPSIFVVDAQARNVSEQIEINECERMGGFSPAVYENANHTLPKAIVFGDSFSWSMHPWLAEHFSRLVYLPEHVLDPAVIEREKPDVVIHELVERKLFIVPPHDPICHPIDVGIPPQAEISANPTR